MKPEYGATPTAALVWFYQYHDRTPIPLIFLTSKGKVGIGVENPTSEFQVVGDIKASGNLLGTVPYDNQISGLPASTLKTAVDEIATTPLDDNQYRLAYTGNTFIPNDNLHKFNRVEWPNTYQVTVPLNALDEFYITLNGTTDIPQNNTNTVLDDKSGCIELSGLLWRVKLGLPGMFKLTLKTSLRVKTLIVEKIV